MSEPTVRGCLRYCTMISCGRSDPFTIQDLMTSSRIATTNEYVPDNSSLQLGRVVQGHRKMAENHCSVPKPNPSPNLTLFRLFCQYPSHSCMILRHHWTLMKLGLLTFSTPKHGLPTLRLLFLSACTSPLVCIVVGVLPEAGGRHGGQCGGGEDQSTET